jgi:hypothetical protein
MGEAQFDTPLYRSFAELRNTDRLLDRVSILRFLHLIEGHDLDKQFSDL